MNPPLNGKDALTLDELEPKRIGHFVVRQDLLDHPSIWKMFALLKFIPLSVQHDWKNMAVHFYGLSPRFEPCARAMQLPPERWPMYAIDLNFDKDLISDKLILFSINVKQAKAASQIQIARA